MIRRGSALFLALALTYGQFFQAATWGAACRFDLARALAERGTVSIDAYHGNTGDKAFFAGRYYSDKGPLPSFLASPAISFAHAIRDVAGRPRSDAVWLALAGGLAAFAASGVATAAGGALLFRVLAERGASAPAAALSTVFAFLGTTLFPYATVLQGHALAAALLLAFFAAAFPPRGAPGPRRSILAGVAASAALATEVLSVPALAILGVASLLRHRSVARRHLAGMAAGALPGLALLGAYHSRAFASPFSFGYQYVALPFFQEKMERGLFGIGVPDPVVAVRLLFGPWRGLFFACPVLIAALAGLARLLRDPARRIEAAAALTAFLVCLAINAGYTTWHGGWAIGARHLVSVIPLVALGLPAALACWPRLTCAAGAVSILFMLAATAVQPEAPEEIANPLFDHHLPSLVQGRLSVAEQGFADLYPARDDPAVPDRWDAFLLGEALRLPGLLALLPLAVPWAVFGRRALGR